MSGLRPRVADLLFRVYDRPVHPELFEAAAERIVRRHDYTLAVRLTPTGHVIAWSDGTTHLVELTTSGTHDLPDGGRLTQRFHGERRGQCDIGPVRYQVGLQTEVLLPELYVHVHDELAADAGRGLLHYFAPHQRMALAPFGLITVEPLPTGLSVATFHTFPAEYTVVKTQSLIEFAGRA